MNGSGKHNNWSLATDKGVNLLSPGETPYENAQFLLFLCAVIKAVDDYQDLLRLSVATAGNDHRLGANEAPPAVVSIFLGDELNGVLEAIETDTPYAVAESLKIYADRLEKAENFEEKLHEMIQKTIKDHKHIIFNGNGYDDTWIQEATEKRGLLNYRTTPDCMPHLLDKKNVQMLTAHKVFSEAELKSRCEIMLENYSKTVLIEANTMIDMAKTEIAPAVSAYALELANTAAAKKAVDASISCNYEAGLVRKLARLEDQIAVKVDDLEEAVMQLQDAGSLCDDSNDCIRGIALHLVQSQSELLQDFWLYLVYDFWIMCFTSMIRLEP